MRGGHLSPVRSEGPAARDAEESAMRTERLSKALAGGILAAGLVAAVAAPAQQFVDDEPEAAAAAVLAAPRSLADAVGIAEGSAGGRAFEASAEEEGGAFVYKVSTDGGGVRAETTVDPTTGEILASEEQGALARLMRDDAGEAAALARAEIGLDDAIAAAEGAAGGRAIEAGIEEGGETPRHEVRVVAPDGSVALVAVDAATGDVLRMGPAGGGD